MASARVVSVSEKVWQMSRTKSYPRRNPLATAYEPSAATRQQLQQLQQHCERPWITRSPPVGRTTWKTRNRADEETRGNLFTYSICAAFLRLFSRRFMSFEPTCSLGGVEAVNYRPGFIIVIPRRIFPNAKPSNMAAAPKMMSNVDVTCAQARLASLPHAIFPSEMRGNA